MKIEYTEKVSENIEDALSNVFCSYAKKNKLEVNYKKFAFSIKDDNEKLIGGIVARAIYKEIHVEDLWVDEKYRGQGYGFKLDFIRKNKTNSKLDKYFFVKRF